MTLRARTADLYEVYWAINVFAQRLDSKQFAEMERTSAAIASMPRNRLREFLPRLQSEVSALEAELQLTNPKELLRLFRTARDTRPGELVYILKEVFTQHFGAYDKVFLTFSQLPPHTTHVPHFA
ncbi:MAG: hypothetical protein P1P84_21040 [Deferrisomatales bacterium]|nr:hypothetical protein [Deferrisomatales bacterium]